MHILLTPAMNVSRCLNSDPHSWSHSSQKISCGFMSGLNDAVANRLRDNGRRGPCVGRKTTPPSTDRGGGKARLLLLRRLFFSSFFFLFYLQVRWSMPLLSTETPCAYSRRWETVVDDGKDLPDVKGRKKTPGTRGWYAANLSVSRWTKRDLVSTSCLGCCNLPSRVSVVECV